ncbi:hypothetical protein LC55x_0280 [Lysobacter capsici]|uniref:hypothetical protein n=1 Tax=Lysobacter capsici TaxID=435897 RepID=UPI00071F882E|nr:hypothetical protein [Lysobacter capsici]ALN83586.1 hypothetical protein LC55x_0280 [Lysobacter capsici]
MTIVIRCDRRVPASTAAPCLDFARKDREHADESGDVIDEFAARQSIISRGQSASSATCGV